MSSASSPDIDAPQRSTAALLLIVAAVAYNLPLAVINAHVIGLGRGAVIAVDALLIGAALLVAALRWRPEMTRWAAMVGCFVLLSLVLSLFRQAFDPKSLRDTMMIAAFIMLGLTVERRDARRLFVGLQIGIALVMLFEVSFPATYSELVGSTRYFIATRGFVSENFFGDLELFGTTRPDERYFLPQTGWIRASSIFLEPLSLGNYASFAMLAMILFWRDWRWPRRALMVAIWALVVVGSDGRFALTSSLVILFLTPLLRRLPAMLAFVYLPLAVIAGRGGALLLGWNPLEDTFPGRLARGMKQLFRLDTWELSGFTVPTAALADSGVAYFVVGQSLLGVLMFQAFVYLQPRLGHADQRLMLHGNAVLFAMSILISISMLSIKTAALLWFFAGVSFAAGPVTTRPAAIAGDRPGPKPRFEPQPM